MAIDFAREMGFEQTAQCLKATQRYLNQVAEGNAGQATHAGLDAAWKQAVSNTELLNEVSEAGAGRPEVVERLVGDYSAEVDCAGGERNWTALMLASYHGHRLAAEALLSCGASPWGFAAKSSPLHAASAGGGLPAQG